MRVTALKAEQLLLKDFFLMQKRLQARLKKTVLIQKNESACASGAKNLRQGLHLLFKQLLPLLKQRVGTECSI